MFVAGEGRSLSNATTRTKKRSASRTERLDSSNRYHGSMADDSSGRLDDGSDACSLDVGDGDDDDEEEDGEEEEDDEEEMREDDEEGNARVGTDKQMVDGTDGATAVVAGMIGDSSRTWKGDADGEKPASDSGRSSRSSLRSNTDAVENKITMMQSVVIRSKVMDS